MKLKQNLTKKVTLDPLYMLIFVKRAFNFRPSGINTKVQTKALSVTDAMVPVISRRLVNRAWAD